MMKKMLVGTTMAILLMAQALHAAEKFDLRKAVPEEAYLVVHAMSNPERDYQKKHYEEIWKTVQETNIIERALNIVTSRAPEQELEQVKSIVDELKQAAAPIDIEALANCEDFIYAQVMQVPTALHLALMQMEPDDAKSTEQGIKNLMRMAEKYAQGNVTVREETDGDASITIMSLNSSPIPMAPTVIRQDGLLILTSYDQLGRKSLNMLVNGQGKSKFDDPRLKEALSHLPEPEDALVFYDGRTQFAELAKIGTFIRQMSNNDPDAERAATLVDLIMHELSILDYSVTVEYTEGQFNKSAEYGKLIPGTEDRMLSQMMSGGQPFENWQRWVPAGALSYSMSTGVDLHPLYEKAMAVLEEHFPESKPGLERFAQIQEQLDVNLDRDILQAFSGESVSVTLPQSVPSFMASPDSFTAMRCKKPERIRELLHRLVDTVKEIPAAKAQQLSLQESEVLEGFEILSATTMASMGMRPVIGFKDGWMIIASNEKVVQRIMETRAGEGETVDQTDAFQEFNLEVTGPVHKISYSNIAENIRGVSQFLNQAGMFAPAVIGMAAGNADPEDLKPVQEALTLLPDVAKIVSKFDFLEAKISVTQAGEEEGTYLTRTAVKVRPYEAETNAEQQ
jgi:hypothetical protein